MEKKTKTEGIPGKPFNLSGQIFGRLRAISPVPRIGKKQGCTRWLCVCECGKSTVVQSRYLRDGRTKSCGCLARDRVSETNTTHGWSNTPEYISYAGAKDRCTNKHSTRYRYYGGRGIEFRFASFDEFIAELGPKPSPKHSVDRINNEGHYEPGNVRWATQTEQLANRRPRVEHRTPEEIQKACQHASHARWYKQKHPTPGRNALSPEPAKRHRIQKARGGRIVADFR